MAQIEWHSKTSRETMEILKTSVSGLLVKEAQKRLEEHGLNKLKEEKVPSRLRIFLRQFKSAFVIILGAAFFISLLLGHFTDAAVICAALLLNALVGFVQENKASQSLAALKKLIERRAKVIRDGKETIVNAEELVVGDIIILSAGDRVPADARLLEIYDFETNEAALTGESIQVVKDVEVVSVGAIVAERKNMVFLGTVAARGRAKAVVVSVGMETAMGEIAQMVMSAKDEMTPLEKRIKKLAFSLTIIIVAVSFCLFLAGIAFGKDVYTMFLTAVAAAVASVPEGLVISIVVTLAIGMQKLVKEKAIVRHLLAAETLGSVSVVCTDKTGTLTQGEMRVTDIWSGRELLARKDFKKNLDDKKESLVKALQIACLCNNAVIENPGDPLRDWRIIADPTEKALLWAGLEAGIKHQGLAKEQPRFDEIPFDSIKKYAVTAHHLSDKEDILYFCGAPEVLLAKAAMIDSDGAPRVLNETDKEEISREIEKFANQGYRVVAAGFKKISCDHHVLDDEEKARDGLVFSCLFLLQDPLRESIKETIAQAKKAGVRTVMITGDHKGTAAAIGKELGLPIEKDNVLTGEELEKMSDNDLEKIVAKISIYARVSPKHKSRIVAAWQKRGAVVAMTGDGVNDAPALKAADIGLAMGDGTDVAKDAADVVLMDNNFKTIIKAIEGGRRIFENIRKAVVYLLSDNFHELMVVGVSMFVGLPLPILPSQILWINLVEDTMPSAALAFDSSEQGLLAYPPQPKNNPLLQRAHKILIFFATLTTVSLLLGMFALLLRFSEDLLYARTMIFVGLSVTSLLYIFSCRNLYQSLWRYNPFSNRFLNVSVMIAFILLALAVYAPFLQKILQTTPLSFNDWLLLFSVSLLNIVFIEIFKKLFIRARIFQKAA